jgi:hypothetical protein
METLGNILETKTSQITSNDYYCKICDYKCCKRFNFDRHLLTPKHIKEIDRKQKRAKNEQNEQSIIKEFECEKCNKIYQTNAGLWKHKKLCAKEVIITNNEAPDKELIMMLVKQNSQLFEQNNEMLEIIKNGTHNNNNNTTNSHNKTFNLQFFLNETCKDAMNIMDFVDSIKLQLSDLERVGELGYIEGISNIIVKNLKELDITQRPVHCTDKKRETMYIKDDDKWEKDDEKLKLHKVVRKVTCKNQNLIPKFKEVHPDCGKYHSKFSDQYNKIVVESMGGPGDNDYEKEEKIIQNISKQVFVDK